MKKIACIFVLLLLTGCQAMIYGTSSEFDKISLGMTKEEVITLVGKPVASEADGERNEEALIYKKMKHAISAWPRTYRIVFKDGKVIKYGEQYQESNVNHY